MRNIINPESKMQANVVANGGMNEEFEAPKFKYTLTAYDKDGNLKWQEEFTNLVTTAGKNDLLDKYFAGSTYTAAWYLGLINSSGYTGVAAGDTAASHGGWTEATTYSASTRPAINWAAASGGSKATSAAVSYTINGTVTIKGAFAITDNTKSGTTGILYSAGTFSADRSLVNTDVLNVNVTMTA